MFAESESNQQETYKACLNKNKVRFMDWEKTEKHCRNQDTHTHISIYICVCVTERERQGKLRTSEVPLCDALHLFHSSSLIRLGWPSDPRGRVTCQLIVYSWAWGLMVCQHLFCEKKEKKGGERGEGRCYVEVVETHPDIILNPFIKIHHLFCLYVHISSSLSPQLAPSTQMTCMCDNSCLLRDKRAKETQ